MARFHSTIYQPLTALIDVQHFTLYVLSRHSKVSTSGYYSKCGPNTTLTNSALVATECRCAFLRLRSSRMRNCAMKNRRLFGLTAATLVSLACGPATAANEFHA